jgi:hypothetical protein
MAGVETAHAPTSRGKLKLRLKAVRPKKPATIVWIGEALGDPADLGLPLVPHIWSVCAAQGLPDGSISIDVGHRQDPPEASDLG